MNVTKSKLLSVASESPNGQCIWSSTGKACKCGAGSNHKAYLAVHSEAACASKCQAENKKTCCQWWPDGSDSNANAAKCMSFDPPGDNVIHYPGSYKACNIEPTPAGMHILHM